MRLALPIGAPGVPVPINRALASAQGSYTLTGQIAGLSYTPIIVSGQITHGSQLIPQGSPGTQVGPTALLGTFGYPGNLRQLALASRGYWRFDTPTEFIPSGTYVYNNNITNFGGTVPAGGMTIDGYAVPAGTMVVQFTDFSAGDFYCTGSTNFVFRGCRIRGINRAPGYFNCNAYTGRLFIFFGDFGGLGAADLQYNEVPIDIKSAARCVCYRNYITYCTSGIQMNTSNGEIVENYIDKVTGYYQPNSPPGESSPKHLNGTTYNGGETNCLMLRNHITVPSPDDAGRTIQDTDCMMFGQDFGGFPGTGTNSDGTTGYQIINNYVGGAGYCMYLGQNVNDPPNTAKNFTVRGNRWTTQWWPNGGFYGPVASVPVWGTLGNTQSDNLWADGPNAGQSVF